MNKVKTVFFCQNCGAQSAKWIGKCPSCGEWNTYAEELIQKSTSSTVHQTGSNERKQTARPLPIHTIAAAEYPRLITPDMELNPVSANRLCYCRLLYDWSRRKYYM
jgi:DNA repair protein RadA/Sms